jgi:hypothetical protein
VNQGQGLAGPGSDIMKGFGDSYGAAKTNQSDELASATSGIKSSMETGGYDPTQLGNLRSSTSDFAKTGGYDPSTLSTINSGYSSLASGGFTPGQEQDYIRQATQGTEGTYGVLADQAMRNRAKTGGLGTGGDISQMARQLSQVQANNTLNAKNSLFNMENSNKVAGLGGLSSTAGNVAAGRLAGSGQQLGLEGNVAAGRDNANSQMSQLFNASTGQVTALGQQMLQSLGLDFGTQEAAIGALTNLSKNPGMFQTVFGDLVAGGGASAGIMKAL